ncbi:hypothetical protein V6N13_011831 [Hibiscus sabdariffa]
MAHGAWGMGHRSPFILTWTLPKTSTNDLVGAGPACPLGGRREVKRMQRATQGTYHWIWMSTLHYKNRYEEGVVFLVALNLKPSTEYDCDRQVAQNSNPQF